MLRVVPLCHRRCLWLLLLAFLTACSADSDHKAAQAGTIRFATGTPLQTFDPHLADSGTTFSTYLTLVYDGLTLSNPDDMWDPLPGLARSWRWLDDTTIEFALVEGVVFSDGEVFDAGAAKANIDRMLRLKGPRFNTMATIRSASVVDPLTLRIHLHRPDPTLLQNLAGSPGMMVSPRAFGNDDLDLNPVGTGPWLYDKAHSTIGEVHRFTPRPDYFDPRTRNTANYAVYVLTNARARLNALISGQVDIAIVTALEAKPAADVGFSIATQPNRWWGMSLVDRNGELVPEFRDVRVRQALGFAVDRQAIADALFFGYARPASQPMLEDLGHVPDLDDFYRYDPEYARQLLASAGVTGFSFTVPCVPDASAEYEAVQHYLRKVGINMEIEVVESGSIAALARTRQYPVNTIAFPNFGPDSRHPAIWETTAVFNPFEVEGVRINELADQARVTMNEPMRYRNYAEYFGIIVREVYALVYLQIDDLIAYDEAKLKGVRVSRYVDPILRDIKVTGSSTVASDG